MSEQLLTVNEVLEKLKIGRTTFYRHLPKLKANGLQVVRMSDCVRIRESSLDRLIKRAAERNLSLF